MPRYKLSIAYDGTDFCGWQRQEPPDAARTPVELHGPTRRAYSLETPTIESTREGRVALRTVQGVLEQAVRHVVREPVEVLGSSRTDSGVHARGQVAAFSCEPRDVLVPAEKGIGWPAERGVDRLVLAINSRLPDDVQVRSAELVSNDFDPIGDVQSKGYSYTFHVGPHRPMWDRRYVHHVWHPKGLDVDAMNAAAAVLVGEHDFAAFAAAGHGRLTTVRTVHECRVMIAGADEAGVSSADRTDRTTGQWHGVAGQSHEHSHGQRVVIRVSGSGFLWNMVRIIAGTLMQVGIGQRTPADVRSALESKDRAKSGPTLGPEGLCLEWIQYRGGPGS